MKGWQAVMDAMHTAITSDTFTAVDVAQLAASHSASYAQHTNYNKDLCISYFSSEQTHMYLDTNQFWEQTKLINNMPITDVTHEKLWWIVGDRYENCFHDEQYQESHTQQAFSAFLDDFCTGTCRRRLHEERGPP